MVTNQDDALELVKVLCALPSNRQYVADTRAWARASGITTAVAAHDTPALYRWLMHSYSYQGVTDRVAAGYIARNGNADFAFVEAALAGHNCRCPKLAGFDAYVGCCYRKSLPSCGNIDALSLCPVPQLPLRKGVLNEQAFSLHLFIRDRADGDLVDFIDAILAEAAAEPDPVAAGREGLLAAFGAIRGISRKLVSMTLAVLLIGADPERPAWVAVGQSMVAIDSLVHAFLHRTGILAAHGAKHAYGQRCYSALGCEEIIRSLAHRFDARTVDPSYPAIFPRLVQHAIWSFCAVGEQNVCNGRNIDDRRSCGLAACPLWKDCARTPLRPPPSGEAS